MLLALSLPAQTDRTPRYMQKALAAMHQSGLCGRPVTLVYGDTDGQIGLMIRSTPGQRAFVVGPLEANYPQSAVREIEDTGLDTPGWEAWSLSIDLVPELFPILRHAQFEDLLLHTFADPTSSLLHAIKPEDAIRSRVEIEVIPASHARCHRAAEAVRRLDRNLFRHRHRLSSYFARHYTRSGWFSVAWLLGRIALRTSASDRRTLEATTSRVHEREEDLQAAADKVGGHLFDARIRLVVTVTAGRGDLARDRLQRLVGAFGAFTRSRLARFVAGPPRRGPPFPPAPAFLLSHEELATLWHPPVSTAGTERLRTTAFTEFEAPAHFPSATEPGAVVLGRVGFRDDTRPVVLAREDARRHLYVVGKTGMGKTTLLQTLIAGDLRGGDGVCLIDPHGDLAESLVGRIPSHRTNDVILFDAASREHVVGFNPLACPDAGHVDRVTSGVVSAFKKLHGTSWGPRLEDTLRNAVFAPVEQHGTLLDVTRLLGEKPFREHAVTRIRDEVVRSFWMHEFASWSDTYRVEAVAAIQNKIRPFLTNTHVREIVSRPGPGLNLRRVMDDGHILIVNLSKGRLGEDNSALLGAFLVTSIQQAAMSRADIPEVDRKDFRLYVDEFQNYVSGDFASILSEARKYRLSLTVAHQYLAQLDEDTANAVWGNIGSVVAFQVGSDDAETLAEQLGKYRGQIGPENFTGLPKYTAYVRLLIDGMPSPPFSMRTLPPAAEGFDEERAEIIRQVMRRRFGHPADYSVRQSATVNPGTHAK